MGRTRTLPTYAYKVLGGDDKIIEGSLEASSIHNARQALRKRFQRVMSVEERDAPEEERFYLLPKRGIAVDSLSIYTRQMGVLLGSGIALPRALLVLAQGDDPRLNDIFRTVSKEVEHGLNLSHAMSRHPEAFSPVYLSLMEASEVSGNLDANIGKLNDMLERTSLLQRRVKSAFAYPCAIGAVSAGVLAIFIYYVLPMVEPIFRGMGVELPLLTQIVLFGSRLARNPVTVGVVVFIIAAFVLLCLHWSKTPQGRETLDGIGLRVPLIGPILLKSAVSRVLFTLAVLLDSGVTLSAALKVAQRSTDLAVVKNGLKVAYDMILQGNGITDSLQAVKIFPHNVIKLVRAGEEAGSVSSMMRRASDIYEEEVTTELMNLTTLLEPLMMVVVGGVVGIITIAAFLPTITLLRAL